MVWVIAFGELFFGDLWCVVWGYGGMRTHFSLLNPYLAVQREPGHCGAGQRGPSLVARVGSLIDGFSWPVDGFAPLMRALWVLRVHLSMRCSLVARL